RVLSIRRSTFVRQIGQHCLSAKSLVSNHRIPHVLCMMCLQGSKVMTRLVYSASKQTEHTSLLSSSFFATSITSSIFSRDFVFFLPL
ncbi:hypothetical protein PENTCL1PPCAC_9888, partial [Pristionchus entomophagus]